MQLLVPPLAVRPKRPGRPSKKPPGAPVRRVAPRPGARNVVPLLSMIAAAGPSGRADLVEVSEWVTVENHKVPAGAFVLRIVGDSMAPNIPDGALVLFRSGADDPDGKVVLVEESEDDAVPRYALKKVVLGPPKDGVVKAKLVSFNRKVPARSVELSATSGVRIVAEMVAVLAV